MNETIMFSLQRKGTTVEVGGSEESPWVRVTTSKDHVEYPMRTEDGRLLWDFPERVPQYAKTLAMAAYNWIDEQNMQRKAIAVLDTVMAGPVGVDHMESMLQGLNGKAKHMIALWVKVVEGMAMPVNPLELGSYLNARKK